jgi:AbrB family looped-hinge helix DNA binding protein
MRLTSKGQVTIPQAIREQLGLHPQTEVQFEVVGDAVQIRRANTRSGRGAALIQHIRDIGARQSSRMTTDQILALTRGK